MYKFWLLIKYIYIYLYLTTILKLTCNAGNEIDEPFSAVLRKKRFLVDLVVEMRTQERRAKPQKTVMLTQANSRL